MKFLWALWLSSQAYNPNFLCQIEFALHKRDIICFEAFLIWCIRILSNNQSPCKYSFLTDKNNPIFVF